MPGEGRGGRRRWVHGAPRPRRDPIVHPRREQEGHAAHRERGLQNVDTQETEHVLWEARQRVVQKARVAPAVGGNRNSMIIESDHASAEQDLTKYLPSRSVLTKDIFNGCWRASYGARWSCARSWVKHGGDA